MIPGTHAKCWTFEFRDRCHTGTHETTLMLLSRHASLTFTLAAKSSSTLCHPSPAATAAVRRLTVLALESSADDSCAAVANSDRQILSNVVIKQHHLNVKHGGIHPLEAQHAHERNVVSPPYTMLNWIIDSGLDNQF